MPFNYDSPNAIGRTFEATTEAMTQRINGLMAATYRWMSLGLALTGLTAYAVAHSGGAVLVRNPMLYLGLSIVELVMVVSFTRMAQRVSAAAAAGMFLAFAFVNGLTLSVIFLAYSGASISQAFFVSSGAFAALSVYGQVTKRDLTPVRQFVMIGFWGVLIAMLVNFFMHSAALDFVLSCAGVLVFAGLTAYDNQSLRRTYAYADGRGNIALVGALMLYLDFINMFLFVLRLFNDRR